MIKVTDRLFLPLHALVSFSIHVFLKYYMYHCNQVDVVIANYDLFPVHLEGNTTKSRNSEQTSFCARYSEQSLNITENSEH